jgi:hypothetical protein
MHSHAAARIALERVNSAPGDAGELRLTVADNGCGMRANTDGTSYAQVLNLDRVRVVVT